MNVFMCLNRTKNLYYENIRVNRERNFQWVNVVSVLQFLTL